MKTAAVFSVLLAATTSLAAPAKRADQPVTISGLWASLGKEHGSVQLSLEDPNFNDSTSATIDWNRPGVPPTDSRTADGNYYVHFPDAGTDITDLSRLSIQLERVKGPESISFTVYNEANDSKWTCYGVNGTDVTQECRFIGEGFSVPPTSS
ncbi:uncharacterized protein N7459_004577 [Penicillium hispanicum]|uniref:uncharacterized protein n=1 Tax=Penicillium hispanicum TaxID=1080232 RepID=UPI0025412CBD|nr:uncharacterized protein N7459_004577 [Penicillium hispanicum]KAJ5584777.1 hypothetical protein N7459_004577 [Penicillium hispanicum]